MVPTPANGSKIVPFPSRYLFNASLTKLLEKPAIHGTQRWIGSVLLLAKAGSLKTGRSLFGETRSSAGAASNNENCLSSLEGFLFVLERPGMPGAYHISAASAPSLMELLRQSRGDLSDPLRPPGLPAAMSAAPSCAMMPSASAS